LDTFVERKGRIAILDPSFFLYRLAAQNREMQVRRIPTWLEDGYVCFQEKDLRKALRGSAVLFVNSPCNPTGGILDEESLARIAYWCRRLDMLVFADEVYERFLYAGRHVSLASFADAAPRTITANSFSKSYGMAGARVGYVAGPQHLIQPMVVTLLSTAPFVSAAAQYEALRALTTSQNWFQVELDKLRTRRDWISSRLKRYGLDFSLPRGAFFFWIRVGGLGMDGASFSQLLLEEEQTLVMRGDTCGDSGREYVRISFAGSVDLIEEGINRLGNLLAKHFGVADAGVPSRIASHTQMQAA
jgi:aspartate/methionine/tyrosine aminotransferase